MTDERFTVFDDEPDEFDGETADGAVEEEAPARPARKKKRLRDRWLLLTLIIVLTVGVVAAATVAGWYGKALLDGMDSVQRDPGLTPVYHPDQSPRPSPVPTAAGQQNAPMNLVLMGTDARNPDERGRSDVLILLHITGDRKSAYLISLPRDYWVDIPGKRTAKINAAFSWGGPALTVQTVEQLMNIPIDHTIMIDFEGFTRVIDAVGGITVYNRHASTIDGFTFPEGDVTLNGESGLKFVRNRYGLPGHDFDRSERQRDVIIAVLDKLTSRGVLTNPGMFRDAVTTLGPNFTVDQAFTNDKIIELGLQLRITGGKDVYSMLAPVGGYGVSSDKQQYIKVDEAKLAKLADAIRGDTVGEYYRTQ